MDAWEAKHQVKLMTSQINFHYRASEIRTYQPFKPKHDKERAQGLLALKEQRL